MIYDGESVLMDFGYGRELRYILDGGIHRLDEDGLRRHMSETADTLAKDLYIYLSYDIITDEGLERQEVLNTYFSEIQDFALKARGMMADLYKRDFTNRLYRHHISQTFTDLDDTYDILL